MQIEFQRDFEKPVPKEKNPQETHSLFWPPENQNQPTKKKEKTTTIDYYLPISLYFGVAGFDFVFFLIGREEDDFSSFSLIYTPKCV